MAERTPLLSDAEKRQRDDAVVDPSVHDSVTWFSAYGLTSTLVTVCLRLFFREVVVVNAHKVPASGTPVILVCNHANQFVDAMLLLHSAPRQVSFMIAEKSLHRPLVGDAARAVEAVGVVRAQDEVAECDGVIVSIDCEAGVVRGEGTRFTSQELQNRWSGRKWTAHGRVGHLKPGDKLLKGEWAEGEDSDAMRVLVVEEVVSDTELRIKPVETNGGFATATIKEGGTSFQALPKLAMRDTLKDCARHVASGRVFGIFPEGGSHDQAAMLPLKNGVSLVSLMATFEGDAGELRREPDEVKIVPVGVTYSAGHEFRSRAMVEYGEPITVDPDLSRRYAEGDRGAAPEMLAKIKAAMESVTQNVNVQNLRVVFEQLVPPGQPGVTKEMLLKWDAVLELTHPAVWTDAGETTVTAVLTDAEVIHVFKQVDAEKRGYLDYTGFRDFADQLSTRAVAKAQELDLPVVPAILTEHDGFTVQELIQLARSIYIPAGKRLQADEFLQLSRRFSRAYNALKDTEEGRALVADLAKYWLRLKARDLADADVERSPSWFMRQDHSIFAFLPLILYHVVLLAVLFSVAAPGILLWVPIAVICAGRAEKARVAAVKGSSVKIKGTDTVASAKVVEGLKMVPIFFLLYGILATVLVVVKTKHMEAPWPWVTPILVWFLFPVYMYGAIKLYDLVARSARHLVGGVRVAMSSDTGSLTEHRRRLRETIIRAVKRHMGEILGEDEEPVLPEVARMNSEVFK